MLIMQDPRDPTLWKWLRKPTLSPSAIAGFVGEIELESDFVHVEILNAHAGTSHARFFHMPSEGSQFVEFMFEASMHYEIAGVAKDVDPSLGGRNLMLVIRESSDMQTNIDAEVIDAVVDKFQRKGR